MPIVLNDSKQRRELNDFRRDAPEILDVESAAKFLGVSTKVLRENCRVLEIPHKAIGQTLVFSRRALVDWVARA